VLAECGVSPEAFAKLYDAVAATAATGGGEDDDQDDEGTYITRTSMPPKRTRAPRGERRTAVLHSRRAHVTRLRSQCYTLAHAHRTAVSVTQRPAVICAHPPLGQTLISPYPYPYRLPAQSGGWI
jgi:hypothetical protein